jgi:hypothetical protein
MVALVFLVSRSNELHTYLESNTVFPVESLSIRDCTSSRVTPCTPRKAVNDEMAVLRACMLLAGSSDDTDMPTVPNGECSAPALGSRKLIDII